MRLLIIEDEHLLARSMKQLLQVRGFVIDHVDSAEKALGRLRLYHKDYATILLDISLGGMDGIELTRLLRAERILTPIVVVSAHADVDAKVRALDAGADDFLAKPFSTDELNARVRAILRRPRTEKPRYERQVIGPFTINPEERKVISGDQSLRLTGKEYALLERIAKRPNEIVTNDELRRALWDGETQHESNVLSVHIKNLRRKLQPHRARVETIRGVGYKLII